MLLQALRLPPPLRRARTAVCNSRRDQWQNTDGRRAESASPQAEAHAFTWPLLLTAEGRKYGKSVGNAFWLDRQRTPVFASSYQHFLRVADDGGGIGLRFLKPSSPRGDPRPDEATASILERRAATGSSPTRSPPSCTAPDEACQGKAVPRWRSFSEEITGLDEECSLPPRRRADSRLARTGSARRRRRIDSGLGAARLGTPPGAGRLALVAPRRDVLVASRRCGTRGDRNRGAPTQQTPAAPRRRPGSRGPTCCTN